MRKRLRKKKAKIELARQIERAENEGLPAPNEQRVDTPVKKKSKVGNAG